MGMSTALPLSLVLFIGMAAAMVLPPVRRSVPRGVEALIWLGLVLAGWLTATNVQGLHARNLTETVAWATGQAVNVSISLLIANVTSWLTGHIYGLANLVVLLALLEIFWLAMRKLRRHAKRSLPRTRLGEWFELPPRMAARGSLSAPDATGAEFIDIRTVVGAETIGWYGAIAQFQAPTPSLNEDAAQDGTTRLAS